jgi:hypothetical protein
VYILASTGSPRAKRTVENFVEVLKDTLLATELEPYLKTKKEKLFLRFLL